MSSIGLILHYPPLSLSVARSHIRNALRSFEDWAAKIGGFKGVAARDLSQGRVVSSCSERPGIPRAGHTLQGLHASFDDVNHACHIARDDELQQHAGTLVEGGEAAEAWTKEPGMLG